jgi:hypothetical protein
MQPLSTEKEADLDETICISAVSTVLLINNDPPFFIMHATRYIARGNKLDNIAICVQLDKNPK